MRLDFCVLCGERDPTALEHHHYIPLADGGLDDETNIMTLCGTCHGRVHHIPRPLRLSNLVKQGRERALTRSSAELADLTQLQQARTERLEARTKSTQRQERQRRRSRLPRQKPARQPQLPRNQTILFYSPQYHCAWRAINPDGSISEVHNLAQALNTIEATRRERAATPQATRD